MVNRDLLRLQIQFVKGVGPRRAALLGSLGVESVMDALRYFPARYEDRRGVFEIRRLVAGTQATVIGEVISAELIHLRGGRGRGGLKLFELAISDGSGLLKAKWFNQPYLKKRFKPGNKCVLSGTVKYGYRSAGLEMENPEYELIGGEDDPLVHTGRIVPVYRAAEGISPKQIRSIMFNVLGAHLGELVDPLPPKMLARQGLPGLIESVQNCHFPGESLDIDELNAWQTDFQQRVSFEEFLMLELGLAAMRSAKHKERGIGFKPKGTLRARLIKSLPFKLTLAQERAYAEIAADMASPSPMHRLIQGDVGSGKTIVALMAMLDAVECGYQAALMAPTEILAVQHYLNIHGMVEALGLKIALFTGSAKERPTGALASGEVDIAVGTHALIQEAIEFKALGLAVIDEQHRFGVMQRAVLRKKAKNPDIMVMTATPIPRTLAMTLYGDLDYSVIDELPPGRVPVKTVLLGQDDKAGIYKLIEDEVASGGRAYVVYPLIEESEKMPLRSAVLGEEALGRVFPGLRISLLHGRMKPAEREEVMQDFKRGNIDILVCTTVIEVGVDVPEASLMVIVHAERFGLSQLHQLRGRVGRGDRRSTCVLVAYGPLGEEATRRLNVMTSTNDGFKIAEEDLDIRGPGEMMGTRQSGMPDLRVASLVRDARLLGPARREAFELIELDPLLEGAPLVREAASEFWRGKVELFKTA